MKYFRAITNNVESIKRGMQYYKRRSVSISGFNAVMIPVAGVNLQTATSIERPTEFHVIGVLDIQNRQFFLCAEVTGGKAVLTPFWVDAEGRCAPDSDRAQFYNYHLNRMYTSDSELNSLFMESMMPFFQSYHK